ncbi:SERTA domain-containing protein 2 [Triplophysa rosa]|uniref:SERTA domain-containing protein 2 n=1 Tax=Triplophysa rosa TaxID=992332 RepID=A0A9W7WYC2_TRIRA|nr:SERTA domain-containing protein 2 [Triplophysa rosa]KAI7810408.1 putative SERTA domain-containing protein 2 [Triplophysa rosa]
MLGKGLKRKLEQEEENDLKKMDPHQEVMPTCYWLQRQTVLTLSLLKLHSRPAHSDPGLARRVLITNTLRHIQEELRVEAVLLPQSLPNAGSPSGAVDRERPASAKSPSHTENSLTPVSLLEEDRHLFLSLQSSVAIHTAPSVSKNCPSLSNIKDSFTSALAEIEDLCPAVGITTSLTCPSLSTESDTPSSLTMNQDVPDITCYSDTTAISNKFRHTEPVHESMESNMDSALFQFTPSLLDSAQSLFNHCPSLLADFSLDDFLFTEIDNILFDNTACSSSLSASSGSSKVVSMVRDDFVKTLTSGVSQAALPSSQTFKLDLNDLDHIMEVLVGS